MHVARELNRAHILAALDRKIPEPSHGSSRGWAHRRLAYRAAYLQGGLDFALRDVARPGNAKRYRTDAEAQVAACSDPPAGAGRWTVALLTEAARGPPQMRLDGPDHPGFRGAGWNVIKVVWGSGRDKLLAKDKSGLLVQAH